jgi:hypothetical protein
VAAAESMSRPSGSPATDTWLPGESAMSLNEWAVPSARILSSRATSACSSPTEAGWWMRAAPNVTLPAQLVRAVAGGVLNGGISSGAR